MRPNLRNMRLDVESLACKKMRKLLSDFRVYRRLWL